jgi:hypothetical protein
MNILRFANSFCMVKMYFVACFVNMRERWNIGRMELDVPSSKRGRLLREDGKIE